jgi:hypothetical protein
MEIMTSAMHHDPTVVPPSVQEFIYIATYVVPDERGQLLRSFLVHHLLPRLTDEARFNPFAHTPFSSS